MSAKERVERALTGIALEPVTVADGTPCWRLGAGDLREAVLRLRDAAGFEQSTFVTATDELPAEPRFELNYQFLSVSNNDRVRLKLRAAEGEAVPTIADLYPGATYSEREVWDFFGIAFAGHHDLQRLHMPEGYGHHPLRKDFPHRGIEPDRLYKEWERRHAGGDTYGS